MPRVDPDAPGRGPCPRVRFSCPFLCLLFLSCGPQTARTRPAPARVLALPPAYTPIEQVHNLNQELARLAGGDTASHAAAYAQLWQRARAGDRGARTVQLVFGLRDGLRDGCTDDADRKSFTLELDFLLQHLQTAPPPEWVFAGPTALLALHAVGRQKEQPALGKRVVQAGRDFLTSDPALLGELMADVTHGLRLGCHLKEAQPLQEEAVKLLGKGQAGLLARRDLAVLHFLFGDAAAAQQELRQLLADVEAESSAKDAVDPRKEVVQVLLSFLIDTPENRAEGPPAPRETGPGWQSLRTVQQEASCPDATPADAHLVRVPVPPPPCGPALP